MELNPDQLGNPAYSLVALLFVGAVAEVAGDELVELAVKDGGGIADQLALGPGISRRSPVFPGDLRAACFLRELVPAGRCRFGETIIDRGRQDFRKGYGRKDEGENLKEKQINTCPCKSA